MTDRDTGFASQVRRSRVAVIGGGIAGLVAALECAKVGAHVTVFEGSTRLGGTIASARIGGVDVDLTAEGFPESATAVRALVDELGLGDAVVAASPGSTWIAGLPTGAAPLPEQTLLGIPENPWDDSVRRFIGWRGAWRAYLDRLRPPLTIGVERSLGRLVRTRMGERVLDRMVAPLSVGVYGIHPDDVDVEAAAPGLNAALTRTGSLGAAVADLRLGAPNPPALLTIDGGVSRIVEALRSRLTDFAVEFRLGTRVTAIGGDEGRWTVASEPVSEDPAGDAEPDAPFEAVIVAAPEFAARHLLAPIVPAFGSGSAAPTALELVTLVLESAALDDARADAPASAVAVYAVPGTRRAAGALVLSRRHPELREAAGGHVVRVTFGGPGERPATEGLAEADAYAMAVAEASALLGIDPGNLRVLAAHRSHAQLPRPASAIGRAESNAAARHAVAGFAGLGIVGAWLSGPGLAQVVIDAREEADRVRSTLLWGDSALG